MTNNTKYGVMRQSLFENYSKIKRYVGASTKVDVKELIDADLAVAHINYESYRDFFSKSNDEMSIELEDLNINPADFRKEAIEDFRASSKMILIFALLNDCGINTESVEPIPFMKKLLLSIQENLPLSSIGGCSLPVSLPKDKGEEIKMVIDGEFYESILTDRQRALMAQYHGDFMNRVIYPYVESGFSPEPYDVISLIRSK